MRRSVVMVGLLVTMLSAGRAEAQIAWDAPMLIAPGAPAGFGLYLMEPWPSNDIGVMGSYRTSPVPVGLGFRLGLGEEARDDLAVFGGVDVSGHLVRSTAETPLEILWFAGGGLGVGDDVLLSFPLGVSLGGDLRSESVVFRPYAAPRVVLDALLGSPDDELDLDVAVDLGLDLAFQSSWLIRFAASVGGRDAILIGVAFPTN